MRDRFKMLLTAGWVARKAATSFKRERRNTMTIECTDRPQWTREPVTVSARIKLQSGQTFLHEFTFPNMDEAECFKAWCQRHPDQANWTSSFPAMIRPAHAAIAYVKRFNSMEA